MGILYLGDLISNRASIIVIISLSYLFSNGTSNNILVSTLLLCTSYIYINCFNNSPNPLTFKHLNRGC